MVSFSESTTELIDGVYGGLNAQLIYGTFTTPPNSISGSAVCAFSMQDIADTFEGTFKEQSALNSNWLPVNSAKVGYVYLNGLRVSYSIVEESLSTYLLKCRTICMSQF